MKNTLKITVCAAVLGLASAVQATPISGEVGFNGTYTQNGGTLGELDEAHSFTIHTPVTVASSSGDFAGAGAPISFLSPVFVNGFGTTVGSQLWSITVGLSTYTFIVTSAFEDYDAGPGSSDELSIFGTGIASDGAGPKFDTTGTFTLTFDNSGTSTFLWQSTTAVPDGGATAMLIGVGLLGLGALRRKA